MLKSIKLKHFAIVRECTIPFAKGLNVISGETGAGKTIITKALRLCLGAKADTSLIREGASAAFLEALFEPNRAVYTGLAKRGLAFDPTDPIIIKRELTREGKNRLQINGRAVTLSELQQIAPLFLDLISQNASQTLRDKSVQRELLDLFSEIDLSTYQETFRLWEETRSAVAALEKRQATLQLTLPHIEALLEEIVKINPYDGEDDELFAKHKEFIDTLETFQTGQATKHKLEEASALLRSARSSAPTRAIEEALETALTNVSAASYDLESLLYVTLDEDVHEEIEKRLSTINHLYKKHGGTFAKLQERKKELQCQVDEAHAIEKLIADKKEAEKNLQLSLLKLAHEISTKRQAGAQKLSTLITADLQGLNMKGAKFSIMCEKSAPLLYGADEITFFLQANLGEKSLPLDKAPSGGEIARSLFAIKLHLARAETLIFDEIDANIGGETARKVGERLQMLGKERQALCITHFAQVAEFADHHLQIRKWEESGRTFCTITPLSDGAKKEELLRMLGGDTSLFNSLS